MTHDKERALEVVEFVQLLKLTDDFYGQPFVLLDWMYSFIWDVYGTINDAGYRQYRFAYLEIPKKNAKTTLIAALGVYHLACDGPQGQIYCCAADRKQASLAYKAAVAMIEQDEELSELFKITESAKLITNLATGTTLQVLSSEVYGKHGLNPTVVIFDELHAQPNRGLWDVMTFGAGSARREPLWLVITTAGDDPDHKSIGWEQHEYARKIIDGELIDPTWYARIYNVPEDADIYDEANWYKANPSLGVTISIETVRQEALQARNSASAEKLFRWLRLNQWVSTKSTSWVPLPIWDKTVGKWNPADLVGKRCYAGLDLSSTTDLTGLALLFPPQEGVPDWRALFEAWVPEDKMKERMARDHVPFDLWIKGKFLHATPGDAIDYDFIYARILAVSKQYNVASLCPDPWGSAMLTQQLSKEGMQIVAIKQDMAEMSPAMKEIERLLRTGGMTHEAHPVARWCFGNVKTAVDGNENIKPMKNRSIDRIDVIVALINAMARALRVEKVKTITYERGRMFL